MEMQLPLGRWFSIILEVIRGVLNREMAADEVDSSEFSVLYHLFMYGDGINQEQLTNLLVIDKAAVSRSMAKLQEKGYIKKERNPNDRRAYIITLTDSGRKLEARINEVYEAVFKQLGYGISREEVYDCLNTLSQIVENAKNVRNNWNQHA